MDRPPYVARHLGDANPTGRKLCLEERARLAYEMAQTVPARGQHRAYEAWWPASPRYLDEVVRAEPAPVVA